MTDEEALKHIELLSELRARYSCFDEKEEPYYRALSVAIESIRADLSDRWERSNLIWESKNDKRSDD